MSHEYLCTRTAKIRNYDTNVNKNTRRMRGRTIAVGTADYSKRPSSVDSPIEGSSVRQTLPEKPLIRRLRRSQCEEREEVEST